MLQSFLRRITHTPGRFTLRPGAGPSLQHFRRWHSSYPAASASDAINEAERASSESNDGDDFGMYRIILPEEPFVFGTSHIKPRFVPTHIVRPDYVFNQKPQESSFRGKITLGGEEERGIRNAAKLARDVREFAGSLVKVGITTNEIDHAVHEYIVSHSAYPSPLGYSGFPRSCCTSINNIVVHGIPDDHRLEDGDIVNIDITVFLNGYHGDTSQTFLVGNVDEQGRSLVKITNEALSAGIAACGPGKPFKDIGKVIHALLKGKPYCASSQFTGHGIGPVFHSPPWIIHSLNQEPGFMEPGHCFTIEPSIIQGNDARAWIFPDGWTASTENCARCAQAEHMVLITNDGTEVLTR